MSGLAFISIYFAITTIAGYYLPPLPTAKNTYFYPNISSVVKFYNGTITSGWVVSIFPLNLAELRNDTLTYENISQLNVSVSLIYLDHKLSAEELQELHGRR